MLRRHLTSQGIVDNISSRNMALKRCIPLEMTAFRPPPALGHFRFSELACFPRGPRRILSAFCRARATIHPHHRRHALGVYSAHGGRLPPLCTAQRAALCFMISALSFACDRHQEVRVVNGLGKLSIIAVPLSAGYLFFLFFFEVGSTDRAPVAEVGR